MLICEQCKNEHDGKYGSGRFCCIKCARQFSSNSKREEKNEKLRELYKGRGFGAAITNKGKPLSQEKKDAISKKAKQNHIDNPEIAINRGKKRIGREVSKETRQKISDKCKGKTGGYREGSSRAKGGWYKGIRCDSSWELAWILYNLDHNITFYRNKKSYEYIWEGKVRRYYPDFILEDGTVIEIKNFITEQVIAKASAVANIKIICKEEIKLYLDYVIEKYGKDFTRLYGE